MKKLPYLIRSLRKIFVRRAGACPNCGETRSVTVERKYLVTSLRRCARCLLMFRTPTDSPSESARFYERDYQQGFTTHMPDDEGLKQLTGTEFRGSKKDYSYYLSVLDMLGCRAGQCVVDFGCSWGYGSHQLAHAGYDVSSFEISPSRARYAERKLGARLWPRSNHGAPGSLIHPDSIRSTALFQCSPPALSSACTSRPACRFHPVPGADLSLDHLVGVATSEQRRFDCSRIVSARVARSRGQARRPLVGQHEEVHQDMCGSTVMYDVTE